MAQKKPARRDQSEVRDNHKSEYVDDAQSVLVNRLGITNLAEVQLAEEHGLVRGYATLLREVRVTDWRA